MYYYYFFFRRSQKIEDRNGLCDKDFKVNPVNKTGIDLQSVVSMEILESENAFETKNEEVSFADLCKIWYVKCAVIRFGLTNYGSSKHNKK